MFKALALVLAITLLTPMMLIGQDIPVVSCGLQSLESGVEFEGEDLEGLIGQYRVELIPTWSNDAGPAVTELHLWWEERYEAEAGLSAASYHPLIGYMVAECGGATPFCPRTMSRATPEYPGLHYDPVNRSIRNPAGEPGYIDLGGVGVTFGIDRRTDQGFAGEWKINSSPLCLKDNEGGFICITYGYYCATLIP